MLRTGTAVAAVLVVFAAPPSKAYRFRFHLDAPQELSAVANQVESALERGAFADSLIRPGTTSRSSSYGPAARDSASIDKWLDTVTHVVIVRGGLVQKGPTVEVRLQLLNILTRPMAEADTLRVTPASLDSIMFAQGRRYAQLLTRKRS